MIFSPTFHRKNILNPWVLSEYLLFFVYLLDFNYYGWNLDKMYDKNIISDSNAIIEPMPTLPKSYEYLKPREHLHFTQNYID